MVNQQTHASFHPQLFAQSVVHSRESVLYQRGSLLNMQHKSQSESISPNIFKFYGCFSLTIPIFSWSVNAFVIQAMAFAISI